MSKQKFRSASATMSERVKYRVPKSIVYTGELRQQCEVVAKIKKKIQNNGTKPRTTISPSPPTHSTPTTMDTRRKIPYTSKLSVTIFIRIS